MQAAKSENGRSIRRGLVLLAAAVWCVQGAAPPWDVKALEKAPRTYPAAGFSEPGVQAVFFEGLDWRGKPTRVFAWYGVPPSGNGRKAPGMVLVHGGGGTAFAEWVRVWNRRGYAAIAMDTCGSVPRPGKSGSPYGLERPRHEFAGPDGWGGFDQIGEPAADQWTYHAVADVLLAHSLLRSLPGVDAGRIGLTGISWGGYLTTIAGSIDKRFRFAAPVYGCGFLGEDSAWLPVFQKMGTERAARWLELWDPSRYLPLARVPFLWVTGTNDFAYPFPSLQKSYRLPRGKRTLSIRVAMPHGHPPGVTPEEIHVFANSIFAKVPGLARVRGQGTRAGETWAEFTSEVPLEKAELNYTRHRGVWKERKWETVPARIEGARRVTATVPPDATTWYLNLIDTRGLVVSTEHGAIE